MYTNKRLPKRLTYSMVIVLAIILSFSMLTLSLNSSNSAHAEQFQNVTIVTKDMLKDNGANVTIDTGAEAKVKVEYNNNNKRNNQSIYKKDFPDSNFSYGNKVAWFPNKYFEFPSYGTYDLSDELERFGGVSWDGVAYDEHKVNNASQVSRLFGYQRNNVSNYQKTSLSGDKYWKNNATMNEKYTYLKDGKKQTGKPSPQTGKGVFFKPNTNIQNNLIYFTMALPNNAVSNGNVKLNVKFNTRLFSGGDMRADFAYGIYADTGRDKYGNLHSGADGITAPIFVWDGNNDKIKQSIGVNYDASKWSEDINWEGSGQRKWYGDKLAYYKEGFDGDNRFDYTVDHTVTIPEGTKFIRFAFAFDATYYDRWNVIDGDPSQFSIADLKVTLENSGFNGQNSESKSEYVASGQYNNYVVDENNSNINATLKEKFVDFCIAAPNGALDLQGLKDNLTFNTINGNINYRDLHKLGVNLENSDMLYLVEENNNLSSSAQQCGLDGIKKASTNVLKFRLGVRTEFKINSINVPMTPSNSSLNIPNSDYNNINVDFIEPTIGNVQSQPLQNGRKIFVQASDNKNIKTLTIQGQGLNKEMTLEEGKYVVEVQNSGEYVFTATDYADNYCTSTVYIDAVKPIIANVKVEINNGNGRPISVDVSDDNNVNHVDILFGESASPISMEKGPGNSYTHNQNHDGYYGNVIIKAYDNFNNENIYTIENVDIKAPSISVENIDIVALNTKLLNVIVVDNSSIISKVVQHNESSIEIKDSINVIDNGKYDFIAVDEFNNMAKQSFDVKNIVKIQEDTKLTDILLTGNTIKFNISNLDLGESVKLPVIDGFKYTNENRDFGVMANIVATIDNYVNNETLTSATFIEKVTVPVNVNGVSKDATIGESFTTEAPVVAENQIFVGWRDERGVLVSESDVYTFTVVKATTLTPVFVEKTKTKVIFTSPSGSIIDIKALKYNTVDTIKTNIAEYNVPDPTQMFMDFKGWVVTDKGDGTFEARATFDSNATVVVTVVDTKNQEVVSEPLRYNGKQTFLGDENTIAWATKEGEEFNVIAQTKDLTIYTTATMKVYMLTQEQLNNITDKKGLYIAKHEDGNGNASVTGFIDKNLNVTEVGFIIDGAEKMHINSNTAKVYPARIHPLTNQIIININVGKQEDTNNLIGKKVVMYAKIGNQFVYSNEVVL